MRANRTGLLHALQEWFVMPAIALIWIISIGVGAWIGSEKNRTGEGVVLALLLGLIGVLIIAVLPAKPAPVPPPHGGPWPPPSKWHKQPPPRS